MSPASFLRRLGLGFAALLLGGGRDAGPVTFDEVLRAQRRFDEVRFSPDRRHLLFSEASAAAPTGGLLLQRWSRAATFVADLDGGAVRPVGGRVAAGVGLSCAPWSPDGRFAVLVTARDGVRRFAAWEQRSHALTPLGPPPWSTCGDWLGRRFLYRARLGDVPGVGSGAEAALEHLAGRWRAAWRGSAEAVVTVHSNHPAFPGPTAGGPPEDTGLVLADPGTGRWSVVARGAFTTITPSPDGRTFAALKAGRPMADAVGGLTGRQGRLQVYRATTEGAVLLHDFADLDVSLGALAWSPDGRSLLAAGRRPGAPELAPLVVEVSSGAARWLRMPPGVSLARHRESNYRAALPLGWVAGAPAFIGRSAATLAAPSDLRRDDGAAQGAAYRLYSLAPNGAVSLTDFASQSVMAFAASPSGEALVVADGALWAVEPGRPPRRIGPPDLRITGLTEAERAAAGGPFAHGRIAVAAVDAQGEARRVVLDLATGQPVLSVPAAALRALAPGLDAAATTASDGWSSQLSVVGRRAQLVRAANRDWRDRPTGAVRRIAYRAGGRTLDGWVVLPPGYAGGKLPGLVVLYGGAMYGPTPPSATTVDGPARPIDSGQLWAAQGYAVIYPSTPIGRGFAGGRGAALAESVTAAVDAAAEAGWVDSGRVGLMGSSFGGHSVAAVLSERSDRFKAAIAMHGVYDAGAAWGARDLWDTLVDEDDYGFKRETRSLVEEGQLDLRDPPWRAPEAYRQASPFYQADRIRTPILLMAADLDLGATSLQQTERFYAALVREGNPAVAVRYWGQGHAVEDPAAQRDQWRRATAWFAHHLQPDGARAP